VHKIHSIGVLSSCGPGAGGYEALAPTGQPLALDARRYAELTLRAAVN